MPSNIAQVWNFPSSSGTAQYETLQYVDGSTSCNCKGWTMLRKNAGGVRSCKHTRSVDMGTARDTCTAHKDYRTQATPIETGVRVTSSKNKTLDTPMQVTRKLNW